MQVVAHNRGSVRQRRQSSSHTGRVLPVPLATITSGAAASTASSVTVGARIGRSANTFRPPHSAITSEIRWRPLTVISGLSQI